jgi:hypothetical protein
MDPRKLLRAPERVHAALIELPDERLVAKKDVKIYIPVRFAERGLAEVGIETYIVGVYGIVVEELYYGTSLVNAMIHIDPTSTVKILIGDEEYYEFFFPAGSTIMKSVNLVKHDVITYRIYDELMSKGRVPWYMNYIDFGRIFDSARYHAGANIGTEQEVTELIVSILAREEKDRTKYYRTVIKKMDEVLSSPPAFIPLRSVQYGATNTTNKLAGSYYGAGVISALVDPADRTERIEALLRT